MALLSSVIQCSRPYSIYLLYMYDSRHDASTATQQVSRQWRFVATSFGFFTETLVRLTTFDGRVPTARGESRCCSPHKV